MSALRDILEQPVSELPLRPVVSVSPDVPVQEVADRLREARLGCAVVTGEDGRARGTFTERVFCNGVLRGRVFLEAPVGEHLDTQWACVAQSDKLAQVFDVLKARRLRYLCVTDENGRAVGLVGQKGVMEYVASYFPHHVQVLVDQVGKDTFTAKREGA